MKKPSEKVFVFQLNINFGSSFSTKLVQDARATFSEQVSSVGGTLGLFLGFSVLGMFDIMWLVAGKAMRVVYDGLWDEKKSLMKH